MKETKTRVVVAMSGGVDSSVAAALLASRGYDVIGIMLRLWSESGYAGQRDNRCCTRDQMIDAHLVAKHLGIPFHVLDARDVFKREIVDLFVQGYKEGITPNPCLACNRAIRFTFLLNEALKLGADYLATGHYARVTKSQDGLFELRKGRDVEKDQSYVLSVLNQGQLSRAMFPIGEFRKADVRAMAAGLGLRVANKVESQDLCFVADGNYRRFIKDSLPEEMAPGPILTRDGIAVGMHNGLPNYTIGQRKGLGVSWPEPLYVMEKQADTNTLIVGTREELGKRTFRARRMNWLAGSVPTKVVEAEVKIRYKAPLVRATVNPLDSDMAEIVLDMPMPDITPGQGVVIYHGEIVEGSGIIDFVA